MNKFKLFLKNKIFKRKNAPYFLLFLVIVAGIVFLLLRKKVDQYVVENHPMYQYFSGNKMDYEAGSIKLDKEGEITTISFGDYSVNLDSTPLYFADEEKVLFPQSMSVIQPKLGKQFRINYYSSAFKDLDSYSLKDGNSSYNLNNIFLYDGGDIYFFVEKEVITFGEQRIELSPLSFINVNTFDHTVEVYNRATDEAQFFEEVSDQVMIEGDGYKVNASLDLMYFNDSSKLLIKDIDILKHL